MKAENGQRFAGMLARSHEREPLGRLGALSLSNGRVETRRSTRARLWLKSESAARPVFVRVHPARSAFTLLELLLALALVALLMVGLNMFVFSMGELWGQNTDKRLFEQHVRAVTRFLEHEMLAAALPPSGQPGQAAIAPQEVRPAGSNSDNLLTFELPEGSRLIAWPTQPLPEVVCSLLVREGQGLVLLWHSRLELHFVDDPPHETLISPFVTAMTYDYFDANLKRWTTETTLQRDAASGTYLAPQRVRFKFAYGKLTKDTMIALPIAAEGLPNY